MIFFTSDHHFNHANVIKFCNRPFSSVHQMNDEMIGKWNSVVHPRDIVYHLGDFVLGTRGQAFEITKKLNGKIFFIEGNHDNNWFGKIGAFDYLPPIDEFHANHRTFVLCHYPLLSWNKSHYGSVNLHGHCHGKIGKVGYSGDTSLPPNEKNGIRIDVGVDCWNFYPVSLKQIEDQLALLEPIK